MTRLKIIIMKMNFPIKNVNILTVLSFQYEKYNVWTESVLKFKIFD